MLMPIQDFFICYSCFHPIFIVFVTHCHWMLAIQSMHVPLINKFWENSKMEGILLNWSCILTESTVKFKLCIPVSNCVSYLDSTENFNVFFQNLFLKVAVLHIYWEFSISKETPLIIWNNMSFWHYKGQWKGYII